MRGSFAIGRVFGIQLRVHITFFLLLLWVAFSNGGGGWRSAAGAVLVVLLIFVCVLLHEFGHAFAARGYGISTPDITLLPMGGVARISRMPRNPLHEIVVALAGPAVSAALALLFWAASGFHPPDLKEGWPGLDGLATELFTINLGLLAFNLLPAFPMDGGRVLRALLAIRLGNARATQIAAMIGQVLAVGMAGLGILLPAPTLLLVALFVYLAAQSEAAQSAFAFASAGLRVEDAMVTSFTPLPPDAPLSAATQILLHSSQHAFPLQDSRGEFLGLLTREDLIQGLHDAGPGAGAMHFARTNLPVLHPRNHFSQALERMQESESNTLPVLDIDGRLVGLFTAENVGEFLLVQTATASAKH